MTAGPRARGLFASGALLLATAAFLSPSPVHASPLFELTGGITGQGGLNARSIGAGSSSTYFNPALLPEADQSVDVSFLFITSRIGIHLDPRPTSLPCASGMCPLDVPDNVGSAVLPNGAQIPGNAVPTSWLDGTNGTVDFTARPRQSRRDPNTTTAYAAVGLVIPVFDQWLVFGFYGVVPMGNFTRASSSFVDEREQLFSNSLHAELYEDRLQATSLAFGLGSQITPKFSVGVSATLSLANNAAAPVFVPDASNLTSILLLSDVKVRVGLAPHVGLHYNPTDRVHVSATMHSPSDFEIVAAYQFALKDGSTQASAVRFTHDYMPWEFALGGSVDVLKSYADDVSVVGTLEYALWSKYQDRSPRRVDAAAPPTPKTPQAPYAWKNTLSAAAGVRWRHNNVRMFLDGLAQPSPVPNQTGRTNYVDNFRLGGMAGAEADFKLAGTTFRAGATFMANRLVPRHVHKIIPTQSDIQNSTIPSYLVQDAVPDNAQLASGGVFPGAAGLQTNNPGFPGYSSAGWVFGGSVNLSVLF